MISTRWELCINKFVRTKMSEEKIAVQDLPDLFVADCVQVCLQFICSQGSTSRLFLYFYAVSTQFPLFEKKTALLMDGRTDGYRDAWMHLKTGK